MTEESKYCSGLMKKHFNKELVMTKEDIEDFENSVIIIIFMVMLKILLSNHWNI